MESAESHLNVPYERRWEHLKPTIVKCFLEDGNTIGQLAKRMADDFGFKAEYVTPCLVAPAPQSSQAPPPPQALSVRIESSYGQCRTHQYRYHFKKWGIKKRITTVEKEAVISALGKRKRRQLEIGSSNVQLVQGDWLKPVDKKQLKRYINDSIRTERSLSIRPGL
jgi:hypothetical protein